MTRGRNVNRCRPGAGRDLPVTEAVHRRILLPLMAADTSDSPAESDPAGGRGRAGATAGGSAPAAPPFDSKAAWRARLRRRLVAMDDASRRQHSHSIRRRLTAAWARLWSPDRGGGANPPACLLFAASATEPSLMPLVTGNSPGGQPGVAWIFPKVHPGGGLSLHRVIDPSADLAPGAYGLLEPVVDRCPAMEPEGIGLALVPGLGFAGGGARLGQGGGYFDRLLPQLPPRCLVVGVGFHQQWFPLPPWPCEPHDRPVDAVVTEQGWPLPPPEPTMDLKRT